MTTSEPGGVVGGAPTGGGMPTPEGMFDQDLVGVYAHREEVSRMQDAVAQNPIAIYVGAVAAAQVFNRHAALGNMQLTMEPADPRLV